MSSRHLRFCFLTGVTIFLLVLQLMIIVNHLAAWYDYLLFVLVAWQLPYWSQPLRQRGRIEYRRGGDGTLHFINDHRWTILQADKTAKQHSQPEVQAALVKTAGGPFVAVPDFFSEDFELNWAKRLIGQSYDEVATKVIAYEENHA